MRKIIKLFVILFVTVFFNTVFGSSGETSSGIIIEKDENKTIKELNNEVKELKIEGVSNKIKANKIKNSIDLSNLLRENLSEEENQKLKELLYIYETYRKSLLKQLEEQSKKLAETSDIKKQLISNKLDIYKKLIPYIKKDKFKEYIDFIKKDLIISKQDSEIKDSSIKKNVILKEKVETVKEKIIEHKEKMDIKLKSIISQKIDNKITKFKNSQKFQDLEKKQKEELVKNLIFKTNDIIEKAENIKNKTTLYIKKIEIYTILKEKLEKLLQEL